MVDYQSLVVVGNSGLVMNKNESHIGLVVVENEGHSGLLQPVENGACEGSVVVRNGGHVVEVVGAVGEMVLFVVNTG